LPLVLDSTFPHDWEAEVLTARPMILPARQFVYPARVEEVERGALEIMIRPSLGAGPFLATCALGFAGASRRAMNSAYALGPTEIKAWSNQLSSYWYPSFNTDLIPAGASWPDDKTEADQLIVPNTLDGAEIFEASDVGRQWRRGTGEFRGQRGDGRAQ